MILLFYVNGEVSPDLHHHMEVKPSNTSGFLMERCFPCKKVECHLAISHGRDLLYLLISFFLFFFVSLARQAIFCCVVMPFSCELTWGMRCCLCNRTEICYLLACQKFKVFFTFHLYRTVEIMFIRSFIFSTSTYVSRHIKTYLLSV